jgi:hypothetical protein
MRRIRRAKTIIGADAKRGGDSDGAGQKTKIDISAKDRFAAVMTAYFLAASFL